MNSWYFYPGNHYSHVRGIEQENLLKSKFISRGLVGQERARKAIKIILRMFQEQNFQEAGVLITGANGIGKTTLITALSSSLTKKSLFLTINGGEIFSPVLSKVEILTQMARRAVGVTFFQETVFISGQVINFQFKKVSKFKSTNEIGKIIIKTKNFQYSYEIGPKILRKLIEKKIKPGDFVTINRVNGEVEKRKNSFLNQGNFLEAEGKNRFSSEIENYVVVEHLVTLHELDILNYFGDLTSTFFFVTGFDIPTDLREKIDKIIFDWMSEGKLKLTRGMLFINDAHILDPESFSFLGKNFENTLSPLFILSGGGIDGKDQTLNSSLFFGFPLDFLDRLLILPLRPNSEREIKEILKIKMERHSIFLDSKSSEILQKIALECGINYAIYIMVISSCFLPNDEKKIFSFMIKKAYFLFVDCRRFFRFSSSLKTFFFGV